MRTCDSANILQQKHLVIEPCTFTHKLWAQTSGLQLQLHEIRQIFMPLHYLKPKFKVKSAVNYLSTIWCVLYTKMASSNLITRFMQGFRMLMRIFIVFPRSPNCYNEPSKEKLVVGFGNVCDLEYARLFLFTELFP